MPRLVALFLLAVAVPVAAAAAAAPAPVRAVSVPRDAIVGTAWRVTLRAPAAPTVVARGPATLRARAARRAKGLYTATLRFPSAGTWRIEARLAGRTTRLGSVIVEIRREPLLVNPFAIGVEPSGSLLVGQGDRGPLLRVSRGRAAIAAAGTGVYRVSVTPRGTYLGGADGAIHRLEGSTLVPVTPLLDANAAEVDAAGNVYVSIYDGWVKKVAPDGTVTTIAGDGTQGYAGDGGPAALARFHHPHAVVLGPDGALYVADTLNRRIRRIDLASGVITAFGGDVGVTVSLAFAPDGALCSADVSFEGAPGGLTRTTPDGVTTRVLTSRFANDVAVGPDGTIYFSEWEARRIKRLDPRTGTLETVARG